MHCRGLWWQCSPQGHSCAFRAIFYQCNVHNEFCETYKEQKFMKLKKLLEKAKKVVQLCLIKEIQLVQKIFVDVLE